MKLGKKLCRTVKKSFSLVLALTIMLSVCAVSGTLLNVFAATSSGQKIYINLTKNKEWKDFSSVTYRFADDDGTVLDTGTVSKNSSGVFEATAPSGATKIELSSGVNFTLPKTTVAKDFRRIYLYNSNNTYNEAYAYSWVNEDDFNAEWPGVAMTKTSSDSDYYYVDVKSSHKNVIFSNKGETQTSDLGINDSYSADNALYDASKSQWTNPFIKTIDISGATGDTEFYLSTDGSFKESKYLSVQAPDKQSKATYKTVYVSNDDWKSLTKVYATFDYNDAYEGTVELTKDTKDTKVSGSVVFKGKIPAGALLRFHPNEHNLNGASSATSYPTDSGYDGSGYSDNTATYVKTARGEGWTKFSEIDNVNYGAVVENSFKDNPNIVGVDATYFDLTSEGKKDMSSFKEEISKRRTFAIISHPDAGKTTLTEKLLLYGGAINLAGSVKGKRTAKHAVSDWMEIEKQRGISVTSSVLQFKYNGYCINILDTPGHEDFSEDTYRTLMAADSAVMVIDGSKGVEAQTRKLFKVCVMRHIPIFTFINKMDRDANDTFELLDDIEKELGIATCPINWPIGSGKQFKGVYDRNSKEVMTFADTLKGTKEGSEKIIHIDDPALSDEIGEEFKSQLMDEIELLDGASADFDMELVTKGELSPVFFGSALTNFGVEPFLEQFLQLTTSPLPRETVNEKVEPMSDFFSAFVFKIQANMNKAHRDRVAFMRICSGKFEKNMEVFHVQGNKKMRLSQPQQIMAQEREIVDEAYAGDIIGVFDPGVYSIGDTLTTAKDKFEFEGIPTFAPEHFARVSLVDSMKRKQFVKGVTQIAQEGAIQMFQEYKGGMEEIIVGVVGVLQFDVLKFRLENEYNVQIRLENLPYEHIRWIENKDEVNVDTINGTSDMKKVVDMKGNPLLLFINEWSIGMTLDRNDGLVLTEFGRN